VLLAAPQNGTPERVPGGGISLACALRCWAFGYFGRRAGALEEVRPQKSAARGVGLHLYQILNKFAEFAKQLYSSPFVMLVGPRASSWHLALGTTSRAQ
jgi:hypothetical protein